MRNLTYTVTMRNVPDDVEAGDLADAIWEGLAAYVQDWPEIDVSPIRLILPGEQVDFT